MLSALRRYGVAIFVVLAGPGAAFAQSSQAAQHFDRDSLNAFVSTAEWSALVAADRSSTPAGISGYAVLNRFDFNGGFSQCLAGNFELTVNNGRATLSFMTQDGFNCVAGERVSVDCQATSESGLFHNVTNGTARILAFDQQYTTHGVIDTYNSLACAVTVVDGTFAGSGGAGKERLTSTQ
jgi:hypothetical protein